MFLLPYYNIYRIPKAILTLAVTIMDVKHCIVSLDNGILWDRNNSILWENLVWLVITLVALLLFLFIIADILPEASD